MRRRTIFAQGVQSAGLWILFVLLCLVGASACNGKGTEPEGTEGTEVTETEQPPSGPAVRLKFQDFATDPARLASLRKAIEVMKSRNTAAPDSTDYRLSWEYWSAMHGYYGTQAKAGLIQDAIDAAPPNRKAFFDGLRDLTFPGQPPGLAAQVWDMCTHGDIQFLTWHRMYLIRLEKVLQQAAGDPNLRLPYWDYTDPAQLQLPAEFAQETVSGTPNSLFDKRRRSQTVALSSPATDVDDLLQVTAFEDFSGELEQQPHGYVHCTVGPGCPYPLMGDVPVAANDPIFWLHHANIDRLFECWRQRGGTVPSDPAFLAQEYSFVDANGALVTMKVGDLFEASGPVDYTYDNIANCSRQPIPPPAPPQAGLQGAEITELAKASSVKIDDPSEVVKIAVPKAGAAADALRSSLEAPDGPVKTELVLENIEVAAPPGVLFDVYLATTGANPRREYVGTITFFGLGRGGHAGHGSAIRARKFDVTDELLALKGTAATLPEVQVVFEASLGVADSTLAAATPLFNKQSGLKVGSIQLRVKKE